MIRLSRGIRYISIQHRVANPSSALFIRSFSKEANEKPNGIPYSKLTVGVPKERYHLEKRVAATPEVRILSNEPLFHCIDFNLFHRYYGLMLALRHNSLIF